MSSFLDYVDRRDRVDVLSALIAYRRQSVRMKSVEQAEAFIAAELLKGNYFDVLGDSSMRREHTPDILRQLARQFPSKQRCGHKTGRIKRVHKLSHPEAVAKLLLARRQQHFDLLLSDKIAGPVARLL